MSVFTYENFIRNNQAYSNGHVTKMPKTLSCDNYFDNLRMSETSAGLNGFFFSCPDFRNSHSDLTTISATFSFRLR